MYLQSCPLVTTHGGACSGYASAASSSGDLVAGVASNEVTDPGSILGVAIFPGLRLNSESEPLIKRSDS